MSVSLRAMMEAGWDMSAIKNNSAREKGIQLFWRGQDTAQNQKSQVRLYWNMRTKGGIPSDVTCYMSALEVDFYYR